MTISLTVRQLLDAGLSIDHALIAVGVFEAQLETQAKAELRKLKDRDRKRAARAVAEAGFEAEDLEEDDDVPESADIADIVDNADAGLKERSPTPPKENNNKPPKSPRGWRAFRTFWEAYPDKTGKRAAEIAFRRAVRRAPAAVILAGLERVSTGWTGQAYAPHAARWLNRDGWRDPVVARRTDRRSRKGSTGKLDMTPERRAAAVQIFVTTGKWMEVWGDQPTEAELVAAGGSP